MVRCDFFFHGLARTGKIDGALGIARGEGERALDELLDILARLDLSGVAAVLAEDGFLVGYVLDPVA